MTCSKHDHGRRRSQRSSFCSATCLPCTQNPASSFSAITCPVPESVGRSLNKTCNFVDDRPNGRFENIFHQSPIRVPMLCIRTIVLGGRCRCSSKERDDSKFEEMTARDRKRFRVTGRGGSMTCMLEMIPVRCRISSEGALDKRESSRMRSTGLSYDR